MRDKNSGALCSRRGACGDNAGTHGVAAHMEQPLTFLHKELAKMAASFKSSVWQRHELISRFILASKASHSTLVCCREPPVRHSHMKPKSLPASKQDVVIFVSPVAASCFRSIGNTHNMSPEIEPSSGKANFSLKASNSWGDSERA